MLGRLRGSRASRSKVSDDALRWNPLTDLIGRSLGHFRVVEKIGEGGMGVVYIAMDDRLRRTVALKVLRPEVADDERRRGRFLREARFAASLAHPNVCAVHE